MIFHYQKSTNQILTSSISVLILFSSISVGITSAFGDDSQNNFIAITNDKISNDPMIAKILENIEKSKKEFSNIQQKTDQEKLIEEQRILANNMLDDELERMFKDNADFAPLASFNKFLQTVSDDNTKIIFMGLFDYQQEKVHAARDAQLEVIKNGGTLHEARIAYYETAKIPRVEMIQLVKDLNIESGFSDPSIQNRFDEKGKLPRYDDLETSVVSFVDFTSSAKNVNSSVLVTLDSNESSNDNDTVSNDVILDNNIVRKLLEEIQKLKNKISDLEKTQSSSIQNMIHKQEDDDSIHYASWILDFSQGLGHYGDKVDEIKSIPVNALNAPNSFTDVNNSLALGRQGQVTLGFSQPISNMLIVFEASEGKNIRELATVEVSLDGQNWTTLTQTQYNHEDSFIHEYSYNLSGIGCISHVRVIDNAPSNWGDGFDVDAIGATQKCTDTS